MADTQTKEKEVKLKSRKLTQADINAIEKRLALSGGTTIAEMAADLTNRNGTSREKTEQLRKEIIELQSPSKMDNGKVTAANKELVQKINVRIREEIPALRKVEVAEFVKPIEEYIVSEYGEPIKGPTGLLERHGDRVWVDEFKHYKKRY